MDGATFSPQQTASTRLECANLRCLVRLGRGSRAATNDEVGCTRWEGWQDGIFVGGKRKGGGEGNKKRELIFIMATSCEHAFCMGPCLFILHCMGALVQLPITFLLSGLCAGHVEVRSTAVFYRQI